LGALAAAVGVLLAVGLLILLAVEVGLAEATFPGKPGKIAYHGYDGNDYEIYSINAGGGGKVQLTDNSMDATTLWTISNLPTRPVAKR
jgi:hypothetical protein